MELVRPIIICGGSGTRLWPTSRDTLPKQFADLIGKRSTFQDTVLRLRGDGFHDRPVIVTSRNHKFLVEDQLAEIDAEADIVVEPFRRESGPAILAGIYAGATEGHDHPLLVVAADHFVRDPDAFRAAVRGAIGAATSGHIVTFGITPTHPACEYGYIEAGAPIDRHVRATVRFVEKPTTSRAASYILSGFLWNSGNFLFTARTVLDEYATFDPDTVESVRLVVGCGTVENGALALSAEYFGKADPKSFDYALLEHTDRAAVADMHCGWSDVGSWDALWSLAERDGGGNAARGDVELLDATGCFVSTDGPLTTVVGASDLVVVASRDAILIADRKRSAEVKTLVERPRVKGRLEADSHSRVSRPWGWYQVLDGGGGFQVKRIVVRPGGRLSLQKHSCRAEHWVVVTGTAKVTVGESVELLGPNQHAQIPLGAVHRLENPGNTLVELIEVQSGTYFGEDDIVRLEDVYARA